jgi:hypothetical protein
MCPPGAVLQADVEEVMGRPVFTSAADASVIVRGRIDESTTAVHVAIEARSASGQLLGTRELEARAGECASLRPALGLVLTLLVEGEGDDTPQGEFALGTLRLGVVSSALSEAFPRVNVGVGLALALDVGGFLRLRADGNYWWPVSVEARRGVRAQLEAGALALRACPRVWEPARAFALRICAGTQLGALITSQRPGPGSEAQWRWWAQLLIDVQGDLRLGQALVLEAAIGPYFSFQRMQWFAVSDSGARTLLYEAPRLGLFFRLALII